MNYLFEEGDYPELREAMRIVHICRVYLDERHIRTLISKFPEGQVVLKVNGQLAGCALSIRVNSDITQKNHTYREITGAYTFDTHKAEGNVLYGIDVFVKPEYRGLRLGRRLYDYRKELCEKLNLKELYWRRIPNYLICSGHYTKRYIQRSG